MWDVYDFAVYLQNNRIKLMGDRVVHDRLMFKYGYTWDEAIDELEKVKATFYGTKHFGYSVMRSNRRITIPRKGEQERIYVPVRTKIPEELSPFLIFATNGSGVRMRNEHDCRKMIRKEGVPLREVSGCYEKLVSKWANWIAKQNDIVNLLGE